MNGRAGFAVPDNRLAIRGRALIMGVIVFLGSELMFFGAWLAAYYDLRGRSNPWPPPDVTLDPLEPNIGTALLAISSLFVYLAVEDIKRGRGGRARAWLGTAIGCGAIFLGLTLHDWSKATFTIQSHAYGTVHFGLLGFHAAHVFAGLFVLTFLAIGATRPAFRGEGAAGAEALSYYWHFVFVVWLLIWPTIYYVR